MYVKQKNLVISESVYFFSDIHGTIFLQCLAESQGGHHICKNSTKGTTSSICNVTPYQVLEY